MPEVFARVSKKSLTDALAQHIRTFIQTSEYQSGDRLPSIQEMARQFHVGGPTLREALRKLETVGVVEIRHGSGVYVGRNADVLVFANPQSPGVVTAKLMGDIVEARIPLELQAVSLAATQASSVHLQQLEQLVAAGASYQGADHDRVAINVEFHRQIALASGNTVLMQVLNVLRDLLTEEQDGLMRAFHDCDRNEHREILNALQQREPGLAVQHMRAHLHTLRDSVHGWWQAGEQVRAAG